MERSFAGDTGQQQEESFRGAALVDLPDGMKIRRTRSFQHGSPSVDSSRSRIRRNTILGASPELRKVATRYSLADAASQKSTQCLGHIQCRGLLSSFAAGILLDFSFSHASGGGGGVLLLGGSFPSLYCH